MMSCRPATGDRRRRAVLAAGAAGVVLLLVGSILPLGFLILISTAPGFPEALRGYLGAHPLLVAVAFVAIVWQRREPLAWGLALVVALGPWLTAAAVFLL